jgi:hypothetical protein
MLPEVTVIVSAVSDEVVALINEGDGDGIALW